MWREYLFVFVFYATPSLSSTFFSLSWVSCTAISHFIISLHLFSFSFCFHVWLHFHSENELCSNFNIFTMLTWFSYHLSIFIVDSLSFFLPLPKWALDVTQSLHSASFKNNSAEKNNERKCFIFSLSLSRSSLTALVRDSKLYSV